MEGERECVYVYVKEIKKEKEKEKALHSHWPSLLDSGSTWCWRTHAGPAAATAEGDARLVSLAGAGLPKVQKILVVAAKRDQAGMLSCLLF